MKQFFKLKWFIFRKKKIIFRLSSYVAQAMRCGRDALFSLIFFGGKSERQIGRNKFFICSYSTHHVNDVEKILA